MHHALPGVVQVKAAAFAAVLAGCLVPATAPQSGDQAHLVPATGASILTQEVFVQDGRLFASYVSSGMATAHLLHDGVVLGSWPAKDTCYAVVDPKYIRDDDDERVDTDCSWAVPDLRAGRYAIEVTSAGAVLARADFDVIEVPGAGERTALVVDPAVRTNAPYLRNGTLWAWWPIDARYDWRHIQLHGFAGGAHTGMTSGWLQGPRLREPGDAAIAMAFGTFDLAELHSADVIIASAGRHILGAWQPPGGASPTWTSIEVTDAMATAVVAHVEERLQATTKEYGVTHRSPVLSRKIVPRVCAAIMNAQAMDLVVELRGLINGHRHSQAVSSVTTIGNVSYESDAGAIIYKLPYWDTGRTPYGIAPEETREYKALIRKLESKGAAYKKKGDCFRVFAGYAWVLPEPDVDEPDYVNTCGPVDGCPDWGPKRDPHASFR